MAALTKKDLLEAIEDMPMDAPLMVCQVGGLITEVADAVLSEIQFNNLKYKVIFIKNSNNTEDMLTEKDYKEFVSLVKKMREAQEDVIYKSMFSALDSARPTAYEVAKTKQIVLEQEVDEYLKKMEE